MVNDGGMTIAASIDRAVAALKQNSDKLSDGFN